MLVKPSIDELLPKTQNRYTLALLVAKRTRQLVDGAEPLVESDTPNMVSLASEEVAAGAVVAVPGEQKPDIPLRPEVIAAREAERQQAENDLSLENLRQDFMEVDRRLAASDKEEVEAPRSVLKPLPEGTSFSPELYSEGEQEAAGEIDGQRYSGVRRKTRTEDSAADADETDADETDEDEDVIDDAEGDEAEGDDDIDADIEPELSPEDVAAEDEAELDLEKLLVEEVADEDEDDEDLNFDTSKIDQDKEDY